MSQRVLPSFLAALLPCILLPQIARGQGIGGGMVGQVKDQSGAYVPAALVEVTNTATGRVRTASTDSEGHYELREMPPGSYDLTVLKGGFNTARILGVRLSVTQTVEISDITLTVAPVGGETVEVKAVEIAMVESDSPTLSTSFNRKQIRGLPILTRDVNNLALLAPGVVSAPTFSFANTLVPFAVSGSRGRDNNFIIDSVDNNEPLFGGAGTQFTNTDIFAEYRILTGQYKAEFGRNSGSVINIVTERGGNQWHGSAFWFTQHDALNATNLVEQTAGLQRPAPFSENMLGAEVGGPLKRESSWVFFSYQWDRAGSNLSSLYPQVATLPTVNGLNTLSAQPLTQTLKALLNDPTVSQLPVTPSPCVSFIAGLPAMNPCTISGPSNSILVNGAPVEFGTYLVPRAGVFDVRDHQGSFRFDQRLSQKDDLSGRYLLDDIRTPGTAGAAPFEVGFFDVGLLPDWREFLAQRTQNFGLFWTHPWPRALHELRGSFSRIASQLGALDVNQTFRETLPSATVVDTFATNPAPGGTAAGTAAFLALFPAAGSVFTLGRDSRPVRTKSNLYQVQDNVSLSRGQHSLKFGVNLVYTQSDIRDFPSDLGEYFYLASSFRSGFQNFASNSPALAFQRLGNFGGRGGDILPLRNFSHFYFFEDDIRLRENLTLNLGLRYENFGQPINRIAELNPVFGLKINRDNTDFAPRIGFAYGVNSATVLRGGYGIYYDPTVLNIALLAWQGGRVSPFIAGTPSNVYPQPPFNPSDLTGRVTDCDSLTPAPGSGGPTYIDCTTQDSISKSLAQPFIQNFGLSLQHQFGGDLLVEATYVGNVASRLFQRLNSNPREGYQVQNPCSTPPCATYLPRLNPNRGEITTITNGAHSNYHSLQLSATKQLGQRSLSRGIVLTAAYTWSHMIDNASEIFGPDVRRTRDFRSLLRNAETIEVITPFAQDPNDTSRGERGNSSFDRRHRVALSFLWDLPSPPAGARRAALGGWQISGIFTAQSGQPFSPLNSFGACLDANGDGVLTNDRPSIGNRQAPINRLALVADPACVSTAPSAISSTGYVDPAGNPIDPASARFVQVPLGVEPGQTFTAAGESLVAGNAGRNILTGPGNVNLDFAVAKNMLIRERLTLQFRLESYDLLNSPNHALPIGNIFITQAEAVPALAFGTTAPALTPARVSGIIPENSLDGRDPVTGRGLFLSRRFMNTSSRRIQASLKILF